MSLAGVFNLDPADPRSIARFSYDNFGQHLQIQTAIFRKTGQVLPMFPIDPIPLNAFQDWARNHQSLHSSANQILGLSDYDLTDVDLNKPEQVLVWTQLHGREHKKFADVLGLT